MHRKSALCSLAAAMLLITGVGGGVTRLRAQEPTASPAVAQASAAPATAMPAGGAEATATPAVSPDAGPRIAPPLERYQPSLPQRERSTDALAASGGSHTVVLSTLALVLVVIIIVLLAVK